MSRHHAILWHGHRSREPSSRVHALTVSKQGRRPSPATGMLQHGWSLCADSTVNGSCQQHEAGSTSELSQAASPTAERKKKRDGRFLNGGLCDQALVSLCVVLVLVIRLLVSGKKNISDIWCSTVDARKANLFCTVKPVNIKGSFLPLTQLFTSSALFCIASAWWWPKGKTSLLQHRTKPCQDQLFHPTTRSSDQTANT